MIGLPCGEKNYNNIVNRFHTVPELNGRTDGRTDRIAISVSCINVLTRDKKIYRHKSSIKNNADV